MKCWEMIADRLSAAGWSLGWVPAVDSQERTIWIVDAHCRDGRRFIVRAEKSSPRLSNLSVIRFAMRPIVLLMNPPF
jgi:hypothetical protein